ncbi:MULTISPECIES: hypothetical protein [Pedobacter]|uniref:Uncharacterized protein n=1 Tax=Pedobacter cryoconitis TaxID=188932 RepID=A0A127V7Z3_9SPHI|nr:hypothetical protein [Pedobacter cryoconitis]AMP97416.1 hypothetical protein AY601_0460 [Pedobacter cryoconitis]
MGKQQEHGVNQAPYRVYSLIEFQRLGRLGIWPGANVEGIGYVHQGRPIPKYISVYASKWTKGTQPKRTSLLDKVNSGVLYGGIAAGISEHGKFGSIALRYKGGFNPVYYRYSPKLGAGYRGGSRAAIETFQISGNGGVGHVVGNTIAVAGMGISFYVGVDSYMKDDNAGVRKAIVDIIMTRVGMMSPIGFVISSVYFLIDPLDPNSRNSETRNQEITPIDNLSVDKKIMTPDEQAAMKMRQLNKIERPIIKRKF